MNKFHAHKSSKDKEKKAHWDKSQEEKSPWTKAYINKISYGQTRCV